MSTINRHAITLTAGPTTSSTPKVLPTPGDTQLELAREFGFNDYRKTREIDLEPAYEYWGAIRGYCAKVRTRWDAFLSKPPGAHLKKKIDGMTNHPAVHPGC